MAYTGLRWGEVSALRVRDVDLARRRLDVRRAFTEVEGRLVEGTAKSHQQRSVPLPRFICQEIIPLVADRAPDALVFTSPRGAALRNRNFRRNVFEPAVAKVGLDGLTPHGLRHTAASMFIAQGTPPKVVQTILGHASITMTLDLYGHLYPDAADEWSQRLGEAAEAARVPKMCPSDDAAVCRSGEQDTEGPESLGAPGGVIPQDIPD
jgi:integrase